MNLNFYFVSSPLRAFTLLLHFSYSPQPYHLDFTIHSQQEKAQQKRNTNVLHVAYLHYMLHVCWIWGPTTVDVSVMSFYRIVVFATLFLIRK